MKLLAVAAASAILMLGTAAHAQQKSPLYGELGYTFMKIDDNAGGNTRPGAIRGVLGYDFHPMLAGEFMAGWGINSDSQDFTVGATRVRVETDISHFYGLYIKPKYDYQNWQFFARAGWANTKISATGSTGAITASADDSDNDFSYGVGVNYQFNPKWYGGVDYMVYNDSGDAKVRGFTLSIGYRF